VQAQIYEEILKCLLYVTGANRKYYFKQENLQLVNERVIFKFKTDELNTIKVDLMKIHKHVWFK
jgi:hypothetical protein